MKEIVIAAAQSISIRGDVNRNIESHLKLINLAVENEAQIIVFPELSITGYEPDLAKDLAFSFMDKRITPLKEAADEKNIIVVAGAPIQIESGLHIGSFIFFPNNMTLVYTKHHLHPGEENYFSPGNLNPIFNFGNEIISCAICADITNPAHAQAAAEYGSTVYLAGVLVTPKGYAYDSALLKGYAKKYSMTVLMANHGGDSGGYKSGGRSAVWSDNGEIIAEFDGLGEGLVIASKENGCWKGDVVKYKEI